MRGGGWLGGVLPQMSTELRAGIDDACVEARATALMLAALRGEAPAWPSGLDGSAVDHFADEVAFHGVAVLLHERAASLRRWPERLRAALRAAAIASEFREENHRELLARAVAGMAEREVAPIFLKGTALAYALYPAPRLRMRADTDLIVPQRQVAAADAALLELGFRRHPVRAEEAVYQRNYSLVDAQGFGHEIDLHWNISNSAFLSGVFDVAELAAASVAMPALGPGARRVGNVHSLLLACLHLEIHRVAPVFFEGQRRAGDDRLIWLYDIHLLAGALSPGEWSETIRLALTKGLATICGDALIRARALLGSPCPDQAILALSDAAPGEPIAAYLRAGELGRHWRDLRAVPGTAAKARYLRERLLPSADHMRELYPQASPASLSRGYLRRLGEIGRRLMGSQR